MADHAPDVQQNATPQHARATWEKAFLAALAKWGTVTEACKRARIERSTAYRHRQASKEFESEWFDALEQYADLLEKEARRRAFEGVRKPVYQGGKLAGYVKEYSDTLLVKLLEAKRPGQFRRPMEVTGEGGGPVTLKVVYDSKKRDAT